MGIFDKTMEPVFLKDSSDAKDQIKVLEELLEKATGEIKLNIEKDIKLLSYGIAGEEKEVELKSDELVIQLKAYRLGKSREENVKPYFLFNDKQLEDLMGKMPRNTEELKSVSGFGEIKCEKYGTEIICIINKF